MPNKMKKVESLSSLIKQRMCSLTSKRQTLDITNAEKVNEIRGYAPSVFSGAYDTRMQDTIMGACPTIDLCSQFDSPMLCELKQAYNEDEELKPDDVVVSLIKAHLIEASNFMGAKKKMTDRQLESVSLQIYSMYPKMSVAEFILFCARFRCGEYEDAFGSVDPTKIIQSVRSFMQDRFIDYDVKERREKDEERERVKSETLCGSWNDYELFLKLCEKGNKWALRIREDSKYCKSEYRFEDFKRELEREGIMPRK